MAIEISEIIKIISLGLQFAEKAVRKIEEAKDSNEKAKIIKAIDDGDLDILNKLLAD